MPLSWVTINTARNAMDAPISQDWGNDVVNNLNYLFQNSSSVNDANGAPIVPNASFELDVPAASPQTPTGWTLALGTGATGAVVSSDQNHGGQSFKFTRDTTVGHNGGSLTSSYINVSPGMLYNLFFMLKCSTAALENTVQVAWFTAAKSPISTTTVYDSGVGSNAPTAWTVFSALNVNPPATAVYAQVILNAGVAAVTPASTASIYWDGIAMKLRDPFTFYADQTSTTTFTVPTGIFKVRVRVCGQSFVPGKGGGYAEAVFNVTPGDSITCNLSSAQAGVNNAVHTSETLTATNGTSTANGTASCTAGGAVLVTGGSSFPASHVVLEY